MMDGISWSLLLALFLLIIRNIWLRYRLERSEDQHGISLKGEHEVNVTHKWELDSPHRNLKMKGNLTLRFTREYLYNLRQQNPYRFQSGIDNAANIRQMVAYMHANPYTFWHLLQVVQYINRQCSKHSLYEYDRLQFVLDFVQEPNIRYIHDNECEEIGHARQYVRFPDETLYDKRGDCDCKSFLAAMLFHLMGYNVLILLSRQHEHAAIALEYSHNWDRLLPDKQKADEILTRYEGRNYVFCETTSDGFRIGGISTGQHIADFTEIIAVEAGK